MTELLSITIRCLTYAVFHYVVDLVSTTAKIQTLAYNETAYMKPLYNRVTNYYNLMLIRNSYLV